MADIQANMMIYEQARSVPEEAKKPITAGRLRNFTDVNPMFRIKRMTEIFGPCGIGWWYEIIDKRLVENPSTHEWAAFVDINLFYVDPETGEISHPIPGTGGASFVSNEKNGPYMSDECYKMSLTDALSVAMKAIGIAADVYYQKDRTKYTTSEASIPPEKSSERIPPKSAGQGKNAAGKGPNIALNIPPRVNTNPATEEQKKLLRSLVNVEQLADCDKTYGQNWEKMPASHAAALIKKLSAVS